MEFAIDCIQRKGEPSDWSYRIAEGLIFGMLEDRRVAGLDIQFPIRTNKGS
jgi:hypothetical protein